MCTCTVGGVLNESTGYACKMETLVSAWRTAFNATSEELPFGIVTLAGGSDEGQPYNMAAMRYAQTGNQGWLPSDSMPNTFAAQAFDLGDPCGQQAESGFRSGGDGRCCSNTLAGGGGWPCYRGATPHTPQYMGVWTHALSCFTAPALLPPLIVAPADGALHLVSVVMQALHPRIKKEVGRRLAVAARAVSLGHTEETSTGPVLSGCTVADNSKQGNLPNITLSFRTDLLKGDAIMVMDPLMNALALTDPNSGWAGGVDASLLTQLGPSSPLEIEINGNFTHVGQWLPVSPISQCQAEHYDPHWENHTTCVVLRCVAFALSFTQC